MVLLCYLLVVCWLDICLGHICIFCSIDNTLTFFYDFDFLLYFVVSFCFCIFVSYFLVVLKILLILVLVF